jgi:hypothetical protein
MAGRGIVGHHAALWVGHGPDYAAIVFRHSHRKAGRRFPRKREGAFRDVEFDEMTGEMRVESVPARE